MATRNDDSEYRFLITSPYICVVFVVGVLVFHAVLIRWLHVRARDGRPASDDFRESYFRGLIYVTAARHVSRHVPHVEGMDGKLDTGEGGVNV